jgi:DNA-binding FadR family transcriptional regulator
MACYEVSRAVLRESIRLLEHHQVATMRRGPGGGLFVTEPSAAAITDAAAVYLEQRGLDVAHLSEIRLGLELALVDLTISRLTEASLGRLHASLAVEGATPDAGFSEVVHNLHAAIAASAGNRVLELFAAVLVRLTRLHQPTSPAAFDAPTHAVVTELHGSHAAIVEAIAARDRDIARHRMVRHLQTVAGYLR